MVDLTAVEPREPKHFNIKSGCEKLVWMKVFFKPSFTLEKDGFAFFAEQIYFYKCEDPECEMVWPLQNGGHAPQERLNEDKPEHRLSLGEAKKGEVCQFLNGKDGFYNCNSCSNNFAYNPMALFLVAEYQNPAVTKYMILALQKTHDFFKDALDKVEKMEDIADELKDEARRQVTAALADLDFTLNKFLSVCKI